MDEFRFYDAAMSDDTKPAPTPAGTTLGDAHPASSAAEAIASTSVEERARPAQRAPHRDIPIELEDLCARATTRERAERVQTARELADVVEGYLEGDLERRREQAQRHATAARNAWLLHNWHLREMARLAT